MGRFMRPILAGILGGVIFFVGATLLSGVLPNVENNRLIFGIAAFLFVLFGIVEAISRAFRK